MKVDRIIMRVKALLDRATEAHEIARLTSLLVILQGERIHELEKLTVKRRKVA